MKFINKIIKKKINLVIFTHSIPIDDIRNCINIITNNHPVLCLSPHKSFLYERKKISSKTSKDLIFKSFYELLRKDELTKIDIMADKKILHKYKSRDRNIVNYFNLIVKIKNQRVKENLSNQYKIQGINVLADDLGIDKYVWQPRVKKRYLPNLYSFILFPIKFYSYLKIFKLSTFIAENKKNIFFGDTKRVSIYLDKRKYSVLNYSRKN